MSLLNEPMNSYCVGRNVIELPKSFVLSTVITGAFKPVESELQEPVFEVVIRTQGWDHSRFDLELSKRRAELQSQNGGTINVFKLERKINENAVLFRVQEVEDAYVSEINLLVGNNMVTVRHDSFDGSYLAAEDRLIQFAERIKNDANGKMQGFCLGPILLVGDFKVEKGSYLFRNGAGIDFEVNVDTYTKDDHVPLLARMSGPNSLLSIFDVQHSVLRMRERTVAGMQAQEWLGWAQVSEEPGEKTIQFNLETRRARPGKTAPSLTLTFETAQPLEDGRPTKTMIREDQAVQLWDTVVDSIRTKQI